MTFGLLAPRRLATLIAATLLASLLVAPLSPAASAGGGTPGTRADRDSGGPDAARRPFTIDTNLLSPSGLSAWAIDRYLAANTPLPPIGSAFKAAELKYGVNARYLLAHAMLETAFGTSHFALRYRNLFGWNAFDRDPGRYAARFASFDEGIDYVAGKIYDYYLRPGGRFYGGAPTLRGMHLYASDPKWEQGIARIANSMAIPTLAGRTFQFATPVVKGTLLAGRTATVTVKARPADGGGNLPDGLTVAARWRPVSVVETTAPPAKAPALLPEFELIEGSTRGGSISAAITPPDLPGRYRLELQLRDSDETPLTDGSRLAIPGIQVRVHAQDAVTYDLRQTADGLSITVSNVGRKAIAAIGTGKAASVLTTVAVWSMPRRGPAALLTRIPLAADLKPGNRWSGVIPTEVLADAVPGVLLLRLEVAGSPMRLTTSPPGVFSLALAEAPESKPNPSPTNTPGATPEPTAEPTTAPEASAEPDPSASAGAAATGPTPSPSAEPTPAPTTDPAAATTAAADSGPFVLPRLEIRALTPADPGTAALLKIDQKAKAAAAAKVKAAATAAAVAKAKARAKAAKAGANATASSTPAASATASRTGSAPAPGGRVVRAIRYEPYVSVAGGKGTVVLTNTGTVTYHAGQASTSDGSSAGTDATALVITAIPASGRLSAPIVLTVPLDGHLAPGRSVDVPFRLPALPGVQPAYLVSVRLVTADPAEQPTSAAGLFWMLGAPAAPKPTAAAPAATPTADPSPSPSQ